MTTNWSSDFEKQSTSAAAAEEGDAQVSSTVGHSYPGMQPWTQQPGMPNMQTGTWAQPGMPWMQSGAPGMTPGIPWMQSGMPGMSPGMPWMQPGMMPGMFPGPHGFMDEMPPGMPGMMPPLPPEGGKQEGGFKSPLARLFRGRGRGGRGYLAQHMSQVVGQDVQIETFIGGIEGEVVSIHPDHVILEKGDRKFHVRWDAIVYVSPMENK
ncbi:DUF2642 domain-containing protein [Marininema mesophilum]|uniref:DUF2642 domain-containing protein n=1 Tax=Marininema mesophilum TaxID=1048340 RepID=UPI000B85FB01|nr:DUF2642 domain-containing protein [Marininema mesophilum]